MPPRPEKPPGRSCATAQEQGGYFTAKQAKESGYDYPHLEYHVSTGSFERVEHGLYRLTSIAPGRETTTSSGSRSGAETVTTNRRQSSPTSRPWSSTT